MTGNRDSLLARVREALRVPTAHEVRKPLSLPVISGDGTPPFREFLPQVGETYEDHKACFRSWSERLKTEFFCVPDLQAAREQLSQLAHANQWRRIGHHLSPLVTAAIADLQLERVQTDGGYDVSELEGCDAGISGCDALIAQTGSVLVTTQSAGGRALSVLPPHHLVIASRDQLVPDMVAGFEIIKSLYHDKWPSFMSFITGPSRTGDIERILVLGAHGPKRLTVILVEA